MKGWRGFRRHRLDSFGLKIKSWLRKEYRKEGREGFNFTIKELMDSLELDYDSYKIRSKISSFIQNERQDFYEALNELYASEEYIESKNSGMTEKEIFDKLVSAALSRDIYPLRADRFSSNEYPHDTEWRYFFFNYNNFIDHSFI